LTYDKIHNMYAGGQELFSWFNRKLDI